MKTRLQQHLKGHHTQKFNLGNPIFLGSQLMWNERYLKASEACELMALIMDGLVLPAK